MDDYARAYADLPHRCLLCGDISPSGLGQPRVQCLDRSLPLSIPLPMLWSSTLKPLKKVGLMVVFGGGLLVIMCAVIRCVVIVSVRLHTSVTLRAVPFN